MEISRIWLTDFRSYETFELELASGLTAVVGPNGVGKTNLLEALGLLATLKSFRGAPVDSVVRRGADRAVVRAEGIRDDRDTLIELELAKGRTRAQVNRQRLKRSRDLLGAVRVTVFAPDDLSLVKGGPSGRREYLDDLLVALDPTADALISDTERILKQRNALLRQAHGRLDEGAAMTLDVWDSKLAQAGQALTERRERLVGELLPMTVDSYAVLADVPTPLDLQYQRSWPGADLGEALTAGRDDDVRRGVTLLGPHRDELGLTLDGLAARTEASQGEQRTFALALRLSGHRLVTDRLGEPPLLLLDDVLSELDPDRARALLEHVPKGQVVITSASPLPPAARADQLLTMDGSGAVTGERGGQGEELGGDGEGLGGDGG
ncbi:MAG: DNA replication and repair protein RecF [Actinomycetota bacterium]